MVNSKNITVIYNVDQK